VSYLDTISCDEWVAEHFGDVAHLWESHAEEFEAAAVA
jgi:cysteine synthase A